MTNVGAHIAFTYFTYDDLGRLIHETEADGIEKIYAYDAANNRKSFVLKQNGVTKPIQPMITTIWTGYVRYMKTEFLYIDL